VCVCVCVCVGGGESPDVNNRRLLMADAADGTRAAPLALVLPLVLSLVLLSGLLLLFICRRPKLWKKQLDLTPGAKTHTYIYLSIYIHISSCYFA